MLRRLFHYIIVISIVGLIATTHGTAQLTPYMDQVRAEIEKRGITEEELNLLLLQRGLTIDDIAKLNTAQLEELQQAIEELQANKKGKTTRGKLIDPDGEALLDSIGIDSSLYDIDDRDTIEMVKEAYVFGQQVINGDRLKLIETEDSYLPPSYYRIGAGDVIAVSIFSNRSQTEELLTVADDGSVEINEGRVRVFVKGLTLSEVRQKLINNYKKYARFRSNQINVTLSTVRQITVQVFGEVEAPGAYTGAAVNSVLNFIGAAGGMTDLASVRRVKLIKKNGEESILDLYQLLTSPQSVPSLFLEDGDLILVSALGSVVQVDGAIKRPHRYELNHGEGLIQLLDYAGGLDTDAYLRRFRLFRYDGDRRVVKNIDYSELSKTGQNYELMHGDLLVIDTISSTIENYVKVVGEVRNEGEVERYPGMKLKDLLVDAQLKPTAKTDFAFLKRTKADGSVNMIPISIDAILDGSKPFDNITLEDGDELTVWPQARFDDEQYIKIAGAVRYEEELPYDDTGVLRASDAILMAGGLRRDATDYAHIHRFDPLNPNERAYVRIDLAKIMSDASSDENVLLQPFDSIYVYSRKDFQDEVTIGVSGAVNNPGEFAYGEGLTLRDAIILSGGFKRSSATNDIEVSRVIIKDNQPTKTVVEKISLSREGLTDFASAEGTYELEPFDNIFVRYVPEFELQRNITIKGEIVLPGEYSLTKDNESVFDIITRSGGLTEEAFPEAATLYRSEDSLGYIVMRLDEVMNDAGSRYNYGLKDGDIISIPKKIDYVTIEGATQLSRMQREELIGAGNSIRVPYHKKEDALFYIDYYAGGFADNAIKNKIWVVYPNGEVRTTERKFPFGRKHPEILPGSRIQVGKKKTELYGAEKEEDVNWTKVLGDSVAQAMSILTLILLVQRLD